MGESWPVKFGGGNQESSVLEPKLRKYFRKRKHSYVAKVTENSGKRRNRNDPWLFGLFVCLLHLLHVRSQ